MIDDVVERMKPSLLKHAGCDIIEINPGAGVWSSAVHDLLKPRNHYLMEPDYELYTPLLQPLLDAEGSTYKLIPKSGAVWGHLNDLLSPATLPQQQEYQAGDPRLNKPNDTLLVMANLGWYPRKPFRAFPSISLLVVHQLLSAVRAHSLFHRYGLIRMLIWVGDEEGKQILPRSINSRRKVTLEAEISCSDIFEIASSTVESTRWRRDEHLNVESSRRVLKRMEEAAITTPEGRESLYQLQAAKVPPQEQTIEDDLTNVRRDWKDEYGELEKQIAAGKFSRYVGGEAIVPRRSKINPEWKRLHYLRAYFDLKKRKTGKVPTRGKMITELKELEAKSDAGGIEKYVDPAINALPISDTSGGRTLMPEETTEFKRMQYLRQRFNSDRHKTSRSAPLFKDYETILEMQRKVKTLGGIEAEELQREIDECTAGFKEEIENLAVGENETFRLRLDNRTTFKNEPPILYWDRREAEPLKVNPQDFFPKQELCLLDFHPTSLWPVLRNDFPAAYDVFEFILSTLFLIPTQSVKAGLTAVSPGAFEWLVAECPSLTDLSQGGNPDLDFMTVRCLTLEMFKEIIEAWMRWPFRPDRYELMKRSGSVVHDPDDEPMDKS